MMQKSSKKKQKFHSILGSCWPLFFSLELLISGKGPSSHIAMVMQVLVRRLVTQYSRLVRLIRKWQASSDFWLVSLTLCHLHSVVSTLVKSLISSTVNGVLESLWHFVVFQWEYQDSPPLSWHSLLWDQFSVSSAPSSILCLFHFSPNTSHLKEEPLQIPSFSLVIISDGAFLQSPLWQSAL